MAGVGEEDKQGKDEEEEFIKQERLSTEFVDSLSKRDCEVEEPSKDFKDVRAVKFKKDRKKKIGYVKSSFMSRDLALRSTSGAHHRKRSTNGKEGSSDRREQGINVHKKLSQCISKRLHSKPVKEEEREETFVTAIEESFEFKFKASEVQIDAYASKEQLDKPLFWRGRIDAIGVKKDGTIIVVDWTCCEDVRKFWDTAEFSNKLHQTMVYREMIIAHWTYHYGKVHPKVGILIVPLTSGNFDDSSPRLCLDFSLLKKENFFEKIDEFTWTAMKPRRDVNSLGLEQKTDKVETEDSKNTFIQREGKVKSMTEEEVRDLLTTLLFAIDVCWHQFCYEDKRNLSDALQEGPLDTKYVFLAKKHLPQLQSTLETVSAIEEQFAAKADSGASSCDENNQKLLQLQSLPATVSTIEEQSAAKADSGPISCDKSNQKLPENTRTDVKDVS